MNDEDESVEVWTYIGEHLTSAGKLVNVWMDPAGVDHVVDFKVKAPIGCQFNIVQLADGKVRKGDSHPVLLPPAERDPKWVLDDRAARDRHARIALQKRLAKDANSENDDVLGRMTLDDIQTRMLRTIGRADKRALVAAVLERIGA